MTQPPVTGSPRAAPASDEQASNSALLPRSLFKGEVSPGDTITLTVSAVYGDEVEAEVVDSEAMEPPENLEPPMMSADEEFDMAAEKV